MSTGEAKKPKKKVKKGMFRKLLGLFGEYKAACVLMLVMLIVAGIFTAIGPRIMGSATDAIVDGLAAGGIHWKTFIFWACASMAVYILQFVAKWVAGRTSAGITSRIAMDLRSKVEEKLWTLPLNFYDTNQRGDIMSRTSNDVDNVVQTLNQTGGDFVYYLLMLIGMVAMMFMLSWHPALGRAREENHDGLEAGVPETVAVHGQD